MYLHVETFTAQKSTNSHLLFERSRSHIYSLLYFGSQSHLYISCEDLTLNMKSAPSSVHTASLTVLTLVIVWSHRLCYWHHITLQSEGQFSAQDSQSKSSKQTLTSYILQKKRKSHLCFVYEWLCLLCAELPSTSEGDVCDMSEDRLSSGEAGGQSACVPQLLLPLLTLQHQTQVRMKT